MDVTALSASARFIVVVRILIVVVKTCRVEVGNKGVFGVPAVSQTTKHTQ